MSVECQFKPSRNEKLELCIETTYQDVAIASDKRRFSALMWRREYLSHVCHGAVTACAISTSHFVL
jgi:hypothetical protein